VARPREFDAHTALIQMRDTFWEKGYEATSLADLVEATGVKKASLYAAFGDKQAMYCKALVDYEQSHVDACVNMMAGLHGRDALEALVLAPAEAVASGDRRGCFLCNSSSEQASLGSEAGKITDRGRSAMLGAIGIALDQLRASRIQPGEILAVYFGMRVLARGGMDEAALKAIARSVMHRI